MNTPLPVKRPAYYNGALRLSLPPSDAYTDRERGQKRGVFHSGWAGNLFFKRSCVGLPEAVASASRRLTGRRQIGNKTPASFGATLTLRGGASSPALFAELARQIPWTMPPRRRAVLAEARWYGSLHS